MNYGWNIMEGSSCFGAPTCNRQGLELPALEYGHEGGACSVTGGFVYRGTTLPEINGHYFYADYCLGWLRSFRYENGTAVDSRMWSPGAVGNITSFGEDSAGELYVTSTNGRVYKFARAGTD